ncbi:unnamed protein product [Brassica rapa subsp. trilocularis]
MLCTKNLLSCQIRPKQLISVKYDFNSITIRKAEDSPETGIVDVPYGLSLVYAYFF